MGSPVKIDSLARNLIRLSGYKPDIEIKIEYYNHILKRFIITRKLTLEQKDGDY